MKCPHGHHHIKLGYEKGSKAPYDKRCGKGIERYKDVYRQALAEKKEKSKDLLLNIFLGSVAAGLSVAFGIGMGSVWFAIGMFSVMLTVLFVFNADIRRNQRLEEQRKENITQVLNDFAQNHPGPPIKLIHTSKEVVEQRTDELVDQTTEKLLKLL